MIMKMNCSKNAKKTWKNKLCVIILTMKKRNIKKKRTTKEKKKSVITSIIMKKLRKHEKKRKKVMCSSLGDDVKEKVRKSDEKIKMDKLLQTLDGRSSIFNIIQLIE